MIKKNFTRKDLSNSIYKELGFSKNFSSTIVDDFFEIVIQQLLKFKKIRPFHIFILTLIRPRFDFLKFFGVMIDEVLTRLPSDALYDH